MGDTDSPLWNRLYHYFAYNRDAFLAPYHQRSNVETTFSAVKRVFGGSVRSKGTVAQTNEVLLKVLCHNIRCLIHAIHKLDLVPVFEQLACLMQRVSTQERWAR